MKKKKQARPCVPLGKDERAKKGTIARPGSAKPEAPDGVSGDWG